MNVSVPVTVMVKERPFSSVMPTTSAITTRSPVVRPWSALVISTGSAWVAAVIADAERRGAKVDWVQCGLCVDERGVNELLPGTRRGTPADQHSHVHAMRGFLTGKKKGRLTPDLRKALEAIDGGDVELDADTMNLLKKVMRRAQRGKLDLGLSPRLENELLADDD